MFYLIQDQATIKTKQKDLGKIDTALQKLDDQHKADQEALTQAQEHFKAVSAGLSSNTDGQDATLNDQLMGMSFKRYSLTWVCSVKYKLNLIFNNIA